MSPVIGVILMVAITVILAAVIGTFVLGLGQNVNSTPQASFSFDFATSGGSVDNVTVAHEGGDTLTSDNSDSIRVAGPDGSTDWPTPVTAGDTQLLLASGNFSGGDTVRVVWYAPGNDSSSTIGSQDAPA